MSFKALAFACEAKTARPSDKLVLLGLGDRHNTEADAAYPSIKWLTEFTSLDRKTVIKSLDTLEADGFIADTGDRVGQTRQVKVYRLCFDRKGEESQKRNSSVFPRKQSQKRDTEPVKEPTFVAKATPVSRAKPKVEMPDGWEPQPFGAGTDCATIISRWSDERYAREVSKFKANHLAKASRFANWQQAWGTWVLNSVNFNRETNNGNSQGVGRTTAAAIAAFGNDLYDPTATF